MASLFGVSRDRGARQAAVKQSLTNHLSECVKAIQFRQTERSLRRTIGADDLSNSLCAALEAIFLHGVKDTFFRKAKSAFTGDVDQKPAPNFWPLLLILSHRDNIAQINSLQQITTEIGQCRAWIRIALNDCLFSSYISTITRNMNVSKPYYYPTAYIRDAEVLDVAKRLLEGVESCIQFEMSINSSLLNGWTEEVLMMAGLWTPTMRTCPIASGVDVAGTMMEPEPKKETFIPGRMPHNHYGHMLTMDPDEALNFILSNTPENFMDEINQKRNDILQKSNPPASDAKVETPTKEPKNEEMDLTEQSKVNSDNKMENETKDDDDDDVEVEFGEPLNHHDLSLLGNSISGKMTWSAEKNNEHDNFGPLDELRSSPKSNDTDATFDEDPFVKTPNLRDVVKGLHRELNLSPDDMENNTLNVSTSAPPLSPDDPLLAGLGFEVVSKSLSSTFDSNELQTLTAQISSLSREYGLGHQDHLCISCSEMLGTSISKAKVCSFTGQYFCSSCMDPTLIIIPARVIHNWDFHRYPVSKRASMFLSEFQHQPLIHMKKINPLIYSAVAEMAQMQTLRVQLTFLKAYLFTCRENVIEEFKKRVWPREYLYEHVHVYSISDLTQIGNGSLISQLQKLVAFGISHVKDCWLCSQKGFICEVCHNPKILYPFNIDSTYRCPKCSSVFHSTCLNAMTPCPKCKRKIERQGKSLVEAVHSNFL